jgi:hypothetical protein
MRRAYARFDPVLTCEQYRSGAIQDITTSPHRLLQSTNQNKQE